MEAHAHAVLDAAFDAGIRYVDAARSYGRAEDFLASWLQKRAIEPGQISVASKWGYTYTAGWSTSATQHEVKDHSLAAFERQLAESVERLGRYLSLYQIHSVTAESKTLEDDALIDAIARLRDRGIRAGLSVSGAGQAVAIRRSLEVRRDGERVFDSVQATWNLLERGAESALQDAHDAGMKVVVKESLANGRLTHQSGKGEEGSGKREAGKRRRAFHPSRGSARWPRSGHYRRDACARCRARASMGRCCIDWRSDGRADPIECRRARASLR